jgi:hypothetical protein
MYVCSTVEALTLSCSSPNRICSMISSTKQKGAIRKKGAIQKKGSCITTHNLKFRWRGHYNQWKTSTIRNHFTITTRDLAMSSAVVNDETQYTPLESGVHGRERREERNIEKIDLQRAKRYGMKEPARFGRTKYTYGGIVFIYDPVENREVTSFESPDISSAVSGTKYSKPILLDTKVEVETENAKNLHKSMQRLLTNTREGKRNWTSHSVLIVDMSGSMRRDDVNGARCRSDGVW